MSEAIQVSMVANARTTKTRDYAVGAVLEGIRSGGKKLRGQITQIRNRFESELALTGDRGKAKLAVDALKKQVSGVMWAGQFSNREQPAKDKLQKHSGLFVADLDGLGDKLPEVRKKLEESPHVFASFVSPTGDGLKAVIRVPADASKHDGNFRAVRKHVLERTGIKIDESGKDVARLCFVSFDPELYHNPDAIPLEPLPELLKRKVKTNNTVNLSERQRIAAELLGDIDWKTETSGYCYCPGKHLHTTGDGKRDCKIELDKVPTVHCFHNSCSGIMAGVSHELRSRIGKAEFEPVELPAPLPTYVAPPLDLFPGEVQRFIRAGAETFDVDPAFFVLPILSGAAATIGNARSIRLKENYIEPSIIWTASIASTGAGKSPVEHAVTAPLRLRENELIRKNKEAYAQYVGELAAWEATPKKERGKKPAQPPLLTCLMDDTTIEAAAYRLNDNPRGIALVKDELSHWFESFDQYHDRGGADVSRWLSLWTGNLFALDRVTGGHGGRSYRIEAPRFSITGGVVPEVFKRLLTDNYFERGLPARFLFDMPPRNQPRKWIDKDIPKETKAQLHDLFEQLAALQPVTSKEGEQTPKLLGLAPEAKQIFKAFHNECAARAFETNPREAAQWAKLSAYSARLALVGELLWDPKADVISANVMRAACDLARWFGIEAERIYALIGETDTQRDKRKLIEFIQNRGGEVTEKDIYNNYRALRNKRKETTAWLEQLVRESLGKWQQIPPTEKGGRPTRKFCLFTRVNGSADNHSPDPPGGVDQKKAT